MADKDCDHRGGQEPCPVCGPQAQIVAVVPGASNEAGAEGEPEEMIRVGQWWWVRDESGGKKWFSCVVHTGTNYAKMESPRRGSVRVHFDEFLERCVLEPDPDKVIEEEIARHQNRVKDLLGQVKELTARLAIAPNPMLGSGSETRVLATRGSNQDMGDYGKALEKAKKETLPKLFQEIRDENEMAANWMTARVIPLQAQAKGLNGIIEAINERIFSVELYAGLTEKVERIRDGEPASIGEKVHLMQRRCYMDEECLAHYEVGGMDYQNVGGFDRWLSKDENMWRILPFPRCMVAFRIRRTTKDREMVNLDDFVRIHDEQQADESTFLYIRNGGQLFRMRTKIEFDEKLFPDLDRGQLSGRLWANMFGSRVNELITDNEHQGMVEDLARKRKEWKVANKAYKDALKTPEAKARAKEKKLRHGPDATCVDVPYPFFEPSDHDVKCHVPYERSNVYFDDITKKIEKDIREHNRIALIIQGLLDRSPVLHPHPPWQIWTTEGFRMALELVYDESRVLTSGDKPDFQSYLEKLNSSLKPGCVTVGQDSAWEIFEAHKESRRLDDDWRNRTDYRPTKFRPQGNPGPGKLAKLHAFNKKSGKCTYAWNRGRQTYPYDGSIRATFTCDVTAVMNVDAYKPGDFKTFFNDPRTRAEYLKWAPMLLEAEEFHAGKREVLDPVPVGKPLERSWKGKRRYQNRKLRKHLVGKAVRLTREISTKGGKSYGPGTLWMVVGGSGSTFSIRGIRSDGSQEKEWREITGVEASDFEEAEEVVTKKAQD